MVLSNVVDICLLNACIFQVMGGDPLLTLLTADWLQVDKPADRIALDPKSLVQVYLPISPKTEFNSLL